MRNWPGLFIIVIVLLLILGVTRPSSLADTGYLLTVVAAIATLAGVGFALYGWFVAKELPEMVEEAVRREVDKARREMEGLSFRQQEAIQKVIASYSVDDPDRRIGLLLKAIEIYPSAYNAYVALGYAYLSKGDVVKAQECFREDLRLHPDNYQAASDLAALHAGQKEWLASLDWMRQALTIRPATWRDFESDSRFDGLRAGPHEASYRALITRARTLDRSSSALDRSSSAG